MRHGQPAIAQTNTVLFSFSTKTAFDPGNFRRLFNDIQIAGKDENVYFANVLIHEVFWRGIIEKFDVQNGGTDLSSGSSPPTLIDLMPDEIQRIWELIGFE